MRRPPPPISPPTATSHVGAGSGGSSGRPTAPFLALLAAAVLLCGYEWYRRQLQDEKEEWLRQHRLELQRRGSAATTGPASITAAQPTAGSRLTGAAPAVPAWCDSAAKVDLWQFSERLIAAVQQLTPPAVERAILASHNHSRHSPDARDPSTARLSANNAFTNLQSWLSALQSTLHHHNGESDTESLLSAITVHLEPLQRSLVLLALHPLLPLSIRSQSLSVIDVLSSSSPALSESFVVIGGSALIGHIAHYSPISPSLFIAYKRQLQHQQDAFHQQQLLHVLTAENGNDDSGSSSRVVGAATGALCEIDELLSVLKSMPNLHRHLHVYLRREQQEDEKGAGAESTLPSLHPSLAKEDLEVLNRVPIELGPRRPATSNSSAADVLSTASNAVNSLLTAFLARYTYSYNAVQQDLMQQMERRRVDDHFHAVRLLASMCEQREVCEYLMDRGMMPLLAQWYERGGLSREMRVKVQLSRLVANATSHPTLMETADVCLHSPLILEIVDWAHSSPLQSDDHFLPLNLPIPADAINLSTTLAQATPPPASPSFPATLPTRDSLTAQRAVDALSSFRHSAPARLHQLRQDVVSSISALSSSLPPAVRSRLPSPTSSLPTPSPPITTAEVAAINDSSPAHQPQTAAKPSPTSVSTPPRVGTGNDSYSSLLNVLNSQAVRALANLYAQMERRREGEVYTALQRWWKQQQAGAAVTRNGSTAGDVRGDGSDLAWETLLSKGRATHPLYADEVYLIHPAFEPLSSPSAPAAATLSSASASASSKSSSESSDTDVRSPVSSWYHSSPVVDIVFVHGLLGNPLRTWRLHTSHDEKVAEKDKQLANGTGDAQSITSNGSSSSSSSKEADPTEAQLIAQYTMAQHLRDFIANRKRPVNSADSATQPAAAISSAAATAESIAEQPAAQQQAVPTMEDGATSTASGVAEDTDAAEAGEEDDEEERDVQSSDAEIIWPRDWLPSALPENVRILSIGFRSSLLHEHDSTGNSLVERAQQFIHKLDAAGIPAAAHSSSTATPNVIWITHSMGGLLAKQMVYACPTLLSSTLGLVFLATPHAGAWLPKHSTTRALFGYIATPSVELEQLEENSPHLLTLNQHLHQYLARQAQRDSQRLQALRVLSLGEGQPTPLPPNRPTSPFSLLLVPSKSSNPGYGEWLQLDDENHLNICVTGDHRVLTRTGWRSITAVERGVEVLSLNIDKGKRQYAMEWQPVVAVTSHYVSRSRAADSLYRMQGDGMDVIATRDHRMLLARVGEGSNGQQGRPQIGYETVDELLRLDHVATQRAVLCGGVNGQPPVKLVIPALERVCEWWWNNDGQLGLLRFIGFWLAGGHIHTPTGLVVIGQNNVEAAEWLETTLRPLFPRCWYRTNQTNGRGLSYTYYIRCAPLFLYLRVMAVGPIGYNPLDPAEVRNYPHFTRDEGLAATEQRSAYHVPASARQATNQWKEDDLLDALTAGGEVQTAEEDEEGGEEGQEREDHDDALDMAACEESLAIAHEQFVESKRAAGNIVNGHWFLLKRWLGERNASDVYSKLSRQQAVALLEGFCRAHGTGCDLRYDGSGEPTGQWSCSNSSFPLIDHLMLIGQLAGAAVDLRLLHTQAGESPMLKDRTAAVRAAHWQLDFSFTKSQHVTASQTAPLAEPVEVSDDIDARGYYDYEDDGRVYCIQVAKNSNFLTQRLSSSPGQQGNVVVRAQPVFVGNCKPHSKESVMFRTLIAFVRERIQTMHTLDAQRGDRDGTRWSGSTSDNDRVRTES